MKTIEEIRLDNFWALVAQLKASHGRELNHAEISRALGISAVYVHLLSNGKRSKIDSVAARKIEMSAGKEPGWMDNVHGAWPFSAFTHSDIVALPERVIGRIEERVVELIREHRAGA